MGLFGPKKDCKCSNYLRKIQLFFRNCFKDSLKILPCAGY